MVAVLVDRDEFCFFEELGRVVDEGDGEIDLEGGEPCPFISVEGVLRLVKSSAARHHLHLT